MQMLEGLPRLLLPRQKPATHLRRAPQVAPPADRLQGLTLVVQLKVGAQQQREVEARKGDAVVRPGGGGGTVLGGVGSQEAGEVAHARDACNRRCHGCMLQAAGCRMQAAAHGATDGARLRRAGRRPGLSVGSQAESTACVTKRSEAQLA